MVIEPNWPAYKEGLDYIGARAITDTHDHGGGVGALPGEGEGGDQAQHQGDRPELPCQPHREDNGQGDVQGDSRRSPTTSGLTVISDEIYNDYAYKPCPTILEDLPKKYILTSSFSKAWSMTGFRVGYSLAPAETSSKMLKVLGLMITCVPEFIQRGAAKALECDGGGLAQLEGDEGAHRRDEPPSWRR